MELSKVSKGFTFIKTTFMDLLEMGHPTKLELYRRYYGISDIVKLEDKIDLIKFLQKEYLGCEIDERFIDYVKETRLLKFFENKIFYIWFKDRIFSCEEGRLVLFEEGHFELVENNGQFLMGVERYYYAHAVGELPKKFEVSTELVENWKEFGIDAVKSFVKNKKSEFWTYKPIWLVELKADMENKVLNSMNFDGSDFYLLSCFVPAYTSDEALTKIDEFLKDDFMTLGKIYKVELFDATKKNEMIECFEDENQSAHMAYEKQVITSLGISPGSLYSILVTPNDRILSIWLCDEAFWSGYGFEIELCEFFVSRNACFNRLIELEFVAQDDYDEFKLLDNKYDVPTHFRILKEGNKRFEEVKM